MPESATIIPVRYVWLDQPEVQQRLEVYRRLLTGEEQQECKRYKREENRIQYMVARALVREMLSSATGEAIAEWRFVRTERGKPVVAGRPGPFFNLSHTKGLCAAVVSTYYDVGVDVEDCRRRTDLRLADRYFSTAESSFLRRQPGQEQPSIFFDFWTLKESYIKARGVGLAQRLADFTFHLHTDRPPRISFNERLQDDAARWQFHVCSPSDRHRLAVAVQRPADVHVEFDVQPIVPLS